jgi:hypothetical protein
MPSSVVILRNEKSRQPASQCKSSILTIFIGVPFQSKRIEPGCRVVKDRGLLAFIEVSDGITRGQAGSMISSGYHYGLLLHSGYPPKNS